MKPHDWKNIGSTYPNEPLGEGFRPLGEDDERSHDIIWVKCSGCGAELTTSTLKNIQESHIGWKIPEDCDETIVERIMDE